MKSAMLHATGVFMLGLFLSRLATAGPDVSSFRLDGFTDIQSYRLANGLTVVIWPDPSARQAAVDLWYRVGALNEKPGTTGIAHLFEHMMLRPSRYAPHGGLAFERTLGADVGATTRFRTTNFTLTFGPEKLEDVIRYQADIMKNMPLDATMLASEKEAVRSEYLNWDNTPFMVILPVLAGRAYAGHIAQNFITGARPDLSRITAEDCLRYYRTYYAPNNGVLVIAGKVEPDRAIGLVEKYYGGISRGVEASIPPDLMKLPRSAILERAVSGSSRPLALTYPFPFRPLAGNEDSSLVLALRIAFGGGGSLAGERLINRRKLAESVDYQSTGLGFHFVLAFLTADKSREAVSELDGAVHDIQQLDEAAYRRYAIAAEADLLRGLQSPAQRANALGYYLTHRNGIPALQTDLRLSRDLSLGQLKAVAAKHLDPKHRIAVIGKPASTP